MFKLKYDAAFMNSAERLRGKPVPIPPQPFVFGDPPVGNIFLRLRQGVVAAVIRFGLSILFALGFLLLRVARAVCPNPRIRRLVFVTRHADAVEVLGRTETFIVPYTPEIIALAGGANSILGMDGKDHAQLNALLIRAMKAAALHRLPDGRLLGEQIESQCADVANALLDNSGGRIDVMTDLITRTLTESACTFFGFTVADPVEFAHWTFAFSRLLFGDPTGSAQAREQALNAAARFGRVVDQAIAAAKRGDARPGMIKALVDLQADEIAADGSPTLFDDAAIRAAVLSLVVALIPTNTLAAGNMLAEILRPRRRRVWQNAVALAQGGNDAGLRALLMEAGRLNPALSPGLWRYVRQKGVIASGQGWWRERTVYPNDLVLVMIPLALRDQRKPMNDPDGFDAGRDNDRSLMFGADPHYCIGGHLAMSQITQILKALLARSPDFATRRHRAQTVGPFPVRLDMKFAPDRGTSTMITVVAPTTADPGRSHEAMLAQIDAKVAELGNPAGEAIRNVLTATGIVHFASLAVIEADAAHSAPPIILLEINGDGATEVVLKAVAVAALVELGPIFAYVDPQAAHDADALGALLCRHALKTRCSPFDPTGLDFNGTKPFSVRDIERQSKLAAFARTKLDEFLKENLGSSGRASDALAHVRDSVREDANFYRDLLVPSRKTLALAQWRPSRLWITTFLQKVAPTRGILGTLALFAGTWALLFYTLWHVTGALRSVAWPQTWSHYLLAGIWSVLGVGGGSFVVTLGIFAALAVIFAALLSRHETTDKSTDRQVALNHSEAINHKENRPGLLNNHIIAVLPLKSGFFRRLTLAFALWGVTQVLKWFRPGFVATMGTIHTAKWFVVPGTRQFVFQANYGGSWESYLEDFISRVHTGQSAIWSHGLGFPVTRWLIYYGAEDGDRFKRWVRMQQRPTRFWYCRFPESTAEQIRKNALIKDGLVRATTNTEGRAWLATFGSEQREESEIEADEVQSLVFSGQPVALLTTCLLIKVPKDPEKRRRWINGLTGQDIGWPWAGETTVKLGKPVLPPEMRVSFGDHGSSPLATYLAFTALGLKSMGLPEGDEATGTAGLASFPPAFRMGMVNRSDILGDPKAAWLWGDGGSSAAVDAALLIYGATPIADKDLPRGDVRAIRVDQLDDARVAHDAAVHMQTAFLEDCGGVVLTERRTGPDPQRKVDDCGSDPFRRAIEREPFGFRDGISQPVIRGTRQAAAHPPGRDLVAPGEFILGYRNSQNYFPPALTVHVFDDFYGKLPTIAASSPQRFPHFGKIETDSSDANPRDTLMAGDRDYRDFGRNGTFLVIRDLEQDVKGFSTFTADAAATIKTDYPGLESLLGRDINADWVAAKIVGRWQDGTPLIGTERVKDLRPPDREPDNDFDYGSEDPRGLQCPLGAHVRRANPRDSLQPGDPIEQAITNRHRLLRRGRSYVAPTGERGLLFMCICADLERQFEFVQQSWIGSPVFHGLTNEPDPLISGTNAKDVDPRGDQWRCVFSIPTAGGAITIKDMRNYVTPRAGGYFFMPSRSALLFMGAGSNRQPAQRVHETK